MSDANSSDTRWPPHRHEPRPWRQMQRSGPRADRVVDEVVVAIPPAIADLTVNLDGVLASELDDATRAIATVDSTHGDELAALTTLLLRTESIASSKIERIEANVDDYARALHGIRANPSATSMVAATHALRGLIERAGSSAGITLDDLLRAHRELMADDADVASIGRIRDVQNWIGGSDHSPRNALYVPPPPERVPDAIDDLLRFVARGDLPAIAQAAIAHAQFESIHPFTDGNGRIGRALINAILRRRQATSRIVVPIASALAADRSSYFAALDAYRAGEPRPILASVVRATTIAARESVVSAERLAEIPHEWASILGPVRGGSAAARLLAALPADPVLSAADALALVGGPTSSVYAALERLHDAGVIRPLTDRKRNQVWGAFAVLDELDDLDLRIAAASR